jgi:ribosomal-protein-alanine N-acetyltransferase
MVPEDLIDVLSIESSTSHPWSKKMFLEEMENPFSHCLIAKQKEMGKEGTVGFICFRNLRDESELFKLAVHPRFRKLGIGKKIMEFYLNFCYQEGIRSFFLEVHASNQAAIRLYQLFSYQPSGIRKNFYGGQSDALIMVKRA